MKQYNILLFDTYYKIHFSDIREAECNSNINLSQVFHYGIDFTTDIAGSFVNF